MGQLCELTRKVDNLLLRSGLPITTGNDDGNLSLSDELNTGITCF
jgi:hypothetical protein